jgi:hypothetical protein
MRWIDVPLPQPGDCAKTDRLLDDARALVEGMPELQERHGLDAPVVMRRQVEVGQLLFQGATAADPGRFDPDRDDRDVGTTQVAGADPADPTGYHLVVAPQALGLPWHWLHNGLGFLLDNHPLSVASHGSRIPEHDPARPWMQRHSDALFADPGDTVSGVPDRSRPEILFVPGHGREEIRRLMFREAEGIDAALAAAPEPPARLRVPGAVTPGLLAARAMLYQALHFAAPTSQPPEVSGVGENRWLAGLMAAAGQTSDAEVLDDLVGLDVEIVGVDPVEAALDQALEAYARHGAGARARQTAGAPPSTSRQGWMLEDGPVIPEHLGRDGCLPPLVFSNSWCSLSWLGGRFLDAGASTFVGTAAPVFSRPARLFAALFYGALGSGACVGAAHRQASLAVREKLGDEHPAWLAHGVQGYASLRLCDL